MENISGFFVVFREVKNDKLQSISPAIAGENFGIKQEAKQTAYEQSVAHCVATRPFIHTAFRRRGLLSGCSFSQKIFAMQIFFGSPVLSYSVFHLFHKCSTLYFALQNSVLCEAVNPLIIQSAEKILHTLLNDYKNKFQEENHHFIFSVPYEEIP